MGRNGRRISYLRARRVDKGWKGGQGNIIPGLAGLHTGCRCDPSMKGNQGSQFCRDHNHAWLWQAHPSGTGERTPLPWRHGLFSVHLCNCHRRSPFGRKELAYSLFIKYLHKILTLFHNLHWLAEKAWTHQDNYVFFIRNTYSPFPWSLLIQERGYQLPLILTYVLPDDVSPSSFPESSPWTWSMNRSDTSMVSFSFPTSAGKHAPNMVLNAANAWSEDRQSSYQTLWSPVHWSPVAQVWEVVARDRVKFIYRLSYLLFTKLNKEILLKRTHIDSGQCCGEKR